MENENLKNDEIVSETLQLSEEKNVETSTNEKRCNCKKLEWVKQIVIILVTSFSTVMFTQMFYQKNAVTSAQVNFMMSQGHIYNKVHDICNYDSLMYKEFPAFSRNRLYTVLSDQFGNYTVVKEEFGKDVTRKFFKINAPSFMFLDVVYDKFIQDWNYVQNHQNELTGKAYQIVGKLSELFEKYPIPSKEKRIQEITTHWSNEAVYSQYYKLMDELHDILEKSCFGQLT